MKKEKQKLNGNQQSAASGSSKMLPRMKMIDGHKAE